jgi:hypothetical protein
MAVDKMSKRFQVEFFQLGVCFAVIGLWRQKSQRKLLVYSHVFKATNKTN